MSKKFLLLAIVAVVCMAGIYTITNNRLSADEKLCIDYIVHEEGDGDYNVKIYESNEDYIQYEIYEDGNPKWFCKTDRTYMEYITK